MPPKRGGAASGRAALLVRTAVNATEEPIRAEEKFFESKKSPLSEAAAATTTTSTSERFEIEYRRSLAGEESNWAFDLLKSNMQKLYEGSWGWNDSEKRQMIAHSASRYLLVKKCQNESKTNVGFLLFRPEVEGGAPVLYVYEIQLAVEGRGSGLGTYLMELAENIAGRLKMDKVMLTVFTANEPAVKFYKKIRYEDDSSSPKNESYRILSKNVKAQQRIPATTSNGETQQQQEEQSSKSEEKKKTTETASGGKKSKKK